MENDFQIAAAYVRTIVQADANLVHRLPKELQRSLLIGLESDFLDGQIINQLFDELARQGMSSWIGEYGSLIGVGNHGPLGFAALSAPDLQTALEVFVEYSDTRSSGTRATFEQGTDYLDMLLENQTGSELTGRWLVESTFLVAQKIIETIMAHPLGEQSSFQFQYEPYQDGSKVESLFHAQCQFNQAENKMRLPASWARVPSPLNDEQAFLTNMAKVREIKLQLNTNRDNVRNLVTTRLLNHFDRRLSNTAKHHYIPTLETLSAELNMSARTLIRKLDQQQTSYRSILENVRQKQAFKLLRETHLTAADIALKLGYQEPANFGRAFKRWTGTSPTAWRRTGETAENQHFSSH